jgi:hypothetical protein
MCAAEQRVYGRRVPGPCATNVQAASRAMHRMYDPCRAEGPWHFSRDWLRMELRFRADCGTRVVDHLQPAVTSPLFRPTSDLPIGQIGEVGVPEPAAIGLLAVGAMSCLIYLTVRGCLAPLWRICAS